MIVYVDYSTMKEKKVQSPEDRQRETWLAAVEGLRRIGIAPAFFDESAWSPSRLFGMATARAAKGAKY